MSSASPVTAAAILTGGSARRLLGRDKSRLVVSPAAGGERDGRTILERQLDEVGPLVFEVLIVTSGARAPGFEEIAARDQRVRIVLDAWPGCGPLGAIVTALDATSAAALFVVAGDMPHLSGALLAALAAARGGADAAVPRSSRGLEPLCAVYARSARAGLAAALESGDLSLQHALQRLDLRTMPETEVAAYGDPAMLFRNINTPGDL